MFCTFDKLEKIFTTLPFFVAVLLPLSSYGQDREQLLFLDIPVVTTASRLPQTAAEAPSTVIVITKEQIYERGYNNLLDVLEDLPDVDVQNKSAQEYYNQIAVRGNTGKDKFIIMRDGYKIDSPTNEPIVPIAENFPLFNARQVEVILGPASALYGADAFMGVINIITEDAEEVGGWEASAAAGSNEYYYGHLRYGGRLSENVKLTAGGHWHRSDNADLTKYYDEYAPTDLLIDSALFVAAADREDFSFRTGSYSAFLKLDIDDGFTLGYGRSYFRHPTSAGDLPSSSLFLDDVKWETELSTLYGEYRFDSGDKISGKTSLSYNTYEVLPDSKYKNFWINFEDGYKYALSKKFMFEQQLNGRISDSHILVGGISIEDFVSIPKTADLTKPFDPDLPAADQNIFYGGSDDTIPIKIFELSYQNFGGYLQIQSAWSERTTSTIGVRADHNSRYGNSVNPRVGLVTKTLDKTILKFLYGEAYLAPSPYFAYTHFGQFDGDSNGDGIYEGRNFGLPNPDLKPEKSRTWELDLLHQFYPDFSVEISGYFTRVDDLILDKWYFTDNDYITGSVVNPWKMWENMGHAKFYGGYLSFDYKKKFGAAEVKFWGNYSYVNGNIEEGDGIKREHIYIAHNKVKSGITVNVGKFFITPMVRWIGETNTRWVERDLARPQEVPSYTLVNLNTGITDLINGLNLSVNVRNLLDRRYYNSGGGSSNFALSPQEPRRIVVKMDYKF